MKERDLKTEIDANENSQLVEKNKTLQLITNEEKKVDIPLLLKNKPEVDPELLQKYDDADVDNEEASGEDFDSSR